MAGSIAMVKVVSLTRAAAPKVDLDALATRQRGIVTRGQVLAAGLDDDAIRRALSERRWQRILPGLYGCFSGEPTLEQRRLAAMLYVRGAGQITGHAALVWHGFRHLPADNGIDVLLPESARRTSRGFVRVRRAKALDASAKVVNGYTVCGVARAVADACRWLDDVREVRAIVAEAVQRGLTTIDSLQRELDRAGCSRTRHFRRALAVIAAGARSAPEADLQRLVRRSGLIVNVVWNPELVGPQGERLPSPDGWLPDAAIALEVDSREYHLGPEDWQRTMRRHNTLASYGVLVLHFTPSEIRSRPTHVRHLIEQAYRSRVEQGIECGVRQAQ
jgi:hypothetical protein